MNYYVGVDVGSTCIKVALVDDTMNMASRVIVPTGCHFHQNTINALEATLVKAGVNREDVRYITATGYGRKLFKDADETVTEITANAAGATRIGMAYGGIDSIINIGGQDAKVITLDDDGNVRNFVMNDKCAAGTGRFLEVVARNLEIEVSELGEYHMRFHGTPLSINSTCTVFAESEIISLLANGHQKETIIAGMHYAIAKRIARLAKRGGVGGAVFYDGGPALNKGLVAALEDELMRDVIVPDDPQITTAYGAALIAREAHAALGVGPHV